MVSLDTRRLTGHADLLLEQLPPDRFTHELQRSMVESNSSPFLRLDDLARDLGDLRGAADRAGRRGGPGDQRGGQPSAGGHARAEGLPGPPATSRCSATTSSSPVSS
ncbi:hypothetical protein ACFSTC_31810 [Nonomuraea ferruginea]